jgi:hypothetical protein
MRLLNATQERLSVRTGKQGARKDEFLEPGEARELDVDPAESRQTFARIAARVLIEVDADGNEVKRDPATPLQAEPREPKAERKRRDTADFKPVS